MYYKDFLKEFDVVKYLSDSHRQAVSGAQKALEEKLQKIKDMEERGFELVQLKLVGEVYQSKDINVPVFFETSRFAYYCGDESRAYANVVCFFAKETDVQDMDGEDVYESENGQKFVIHYEHGSLRYLPYYKLRAPRWL